MQVKFIFGLPHAVRENILKEQKHILQLCAQHDILLFVFELHGPKGQFGPTYEELKIEIAKVPRAWNETKFFNDAFNGTTLRKRLQTCDIDTLVLMGMNKSYCVYETAVSAAEQGYKIVTTDQLTLDGNIMYCDDSPEEWYQQNCLITEAISFS